MRPIDADALVKRIQYLLRLGYRDAFDCLDEIDAAPTIDAEPVREDIRGEWEWFDEERGIPVDGWDREWGWRCSCCKDTLNDEYDDPDSPPKFNFCPNCGARMENGVLEK